MVNLRACEWNVFSQSGEDGVLEAIIKILGNAGGSRFAVEFGAGDGVYLSNVRNLILQGWAACLIEGDPVKAQAAAATYTGRPDVRIVCERIQPHTIQDLLRAGNTPEQPDVMVIDLDSNDYYVREAIIDFRPRILMMEYNASFAPPEKRVVQYHPDNYWDGSDYFGASLQSLDELNRRLGYELVHCTLSGINAIWVERAAAERFFPLEGSRVAQLYAPPRYGVGGGRGLYGHGHPALDAAPLTASNGMSIKKTWVSLP